MATLNSGRTSQTTLDGRGEQGASYWEPGAPHCRFPGVAGWQSRFVLFCFSQIIISNAFIIPLVMVYYRKLFMRVSPIAVETLESKD